MKQSDKWGREGGKRRASKLTKRQLSDSARSAAQARWSTPMSRLVSLVAQPPVRLSDIRTGDELIAFRDFWLAKLERNEITLRQFRTKIRRACREFKELSIREQRERA